MELPFYQTILYYLMVIFERKFLSMSTFNISSNYRIAGNFDGGEILTDLTLS